MKQYHFVMFDKNTNNQGWWLKLTNLEELTDYLSHTDQRYAKVFENYIKAKDFNPSATEHGPNADDMQLTTTITTYSETHKQSIVQSIIEIANMKAIAMMNEILDTGCIYVNQKGAYWSNTTYKIPDAHVHRDNLVFPETDINEVQIENEGTYQQVLFHLPRNIPKKGIDTTC